MTRCWQPCVTPNAVTVAGTVATVAIDGAQNAAILAAQIIGITDAEIAYKLSVRREEMRRKVAEKDEKLREQLC